MNYSDLEKNISVETSHMETQDMWLQIFQSRWFTGNGNYQFSWFYIFAIVCH